MRHASQRVSIYFSLCEPSVLKIWNARRVRKCPPTRAPNAFNSTKKNIKTYSSSRVVWLRKEVRFSQWKIFQKIFWSPHPETVPCLQIPPSPPLSHSGSLLLTMFYVYSYKQHHGRQPQPLFAAPWRGGTWEIRIDETGKTGRQTLELLERPAWSWNIASPCFALCGNKEHQEPRYHTRRARRCTNNLEWDPRQLRQS